MQLIPVKDHIAIEPVLRSELEAAKIKERSGILVPPPDNKRYRWEALPNVGTVYALPEEYAGPLQVGTVVCFSEMTPKGIEWDDKKLFILRLDQITATIPGGL